MIGAFVRDVSKVMTQALIDAGLPQLGDGMVQLGKRYLDDATPTSRVVFVPRFVDHGPPNPIAPTGQARRNQGIQRALWTRETTFDVHVFAPAIAPDAWTEFEPVEELADFVIWSVHQLVAGLYEVGVGSWPDQEISAEFPLQTHRMVFSLKVAIPVVDTPSAPALAYVPAGTRANPTVTYQPPEGGTPEAP